MSIDSTTRELIADCLARIEAGDYGAAFDLSSAFMGHLHEKDIGLNLAVVQALALLAKSQGCCEAGEFLTTEWPTMQAILRKRWARYGFSESEESPAD
ncbi:hypothetical protein ACG0Z6_11770 [Roseateles sp. BYS180W]|uniref:Uncharacterized protein n=1 Tax=Roseateles rivi TaxID=3299028 RepID=A0ABW7FX55_9BURK